MAKKKKSFMTPKASRRKARKKRTTITGRKKKEFTYRGYEVEELKAMPLWPSEEDPSAPSVVTLLSSRPRRSIIRGLSSKMSTSLTVYAAPAVVQSVHTAVMFQFYQNSLARESQFTTDRISLKSM